MDVASNVSNLAHMVVELEQCTRDGDCCRINQHSVLLTTPVGNTRRPITRAHLYFLIFVQRQCKASCFPLDQLIRSDPRRLAVAVRHQ